MGKKVSISEVTKNYIEEMEMKDKKKKEIFSNLDYIKLINRIALRHGNFSAMDVNILIDYSLSADDLENYKNFALFFEGIEEYANKNYIPSIKTEWGCYYPIKAELDNEYVGFQIGIDQGTRFYCHKVKPSKNAIDFNDILNNKKEKRAIIIDEKIKSLENDINSLIELGLTHEHVLDILKEENGKQKVKK